MTVFVVDASVAIKWFVPEIDADVAERLLDQPNRYVAPDLLFAEAGNIIWKKVRRQEIPAEKARTLIKDVRGCAVATVSCGELLVDAYQLAAVTGQTVYDCMYLALAVRLETRLITADEGLATAVKALPRLANHVILLSAFA